MPMWIRVLTLSLTLIVFAGCGSPATQKQLADDAVAAMGGADKLKAIQTLTFSGGAGTRTRIGQPSSSTGADVVGKLANNTEILDLANQRAAFDYDITVGEFMQHRHEVLSRENAGAKPIGIESIDGVTFASTPAGLFSWGTQNSPEWLLRRNVVRIALAAASSADAGKPIEEEEVAGKKYKHAHVTGPDGEALGLYFDPETKLLVAFEVFETESMLGDVLCYYELGDYKDVAGVKLPHHIKITKGGDYSEIQYTSIAVNDPKAAEAFALPKDLPADAWKTGSAEDPFPMKLVQAADGVYQAQGFRHHSMVVEFPTFIAVVEAPYLEIQVKALWKAVAAQFPNKPIKYVAVTHPHFDHTGGVRAAAALGATILVARGQDPLLQKLIDARHTLPMDALEAARSAKKPVGAIEVYEGKKVIAEGGQSLELHAYSSTHFEPMVMAYVPKGGVHFQSDIWFPGIGGGGSPAAVELLNAIKAAKINVNTMVGGHGLIGPFAEMTKAIAAMK